MHSGAERCVVRRFAPAGLALLLGSCGDSNAPVAADTLATAPVLGSGGVRTVRSAATFRLGITDLATDTLTNRADLFGRIALQNGDKGRQLVATPATEAEFNRFVSFLTDGINSSVGWVISVRGVSGSVVAGSGEGPRPESSFFVGRPGGGVDFAGYAITSVAFHVDSILFETPGSDPYGNGVWTDYYLRGEIVVVGHRK